MYISVNLMSLNEKLIVAAFFCKITSGIVPYELRAVPDVGVHGRNGRIKADRFAEGTELADKLKEALSGAGAPNI